MSDILPSNATPAERALAQAISEEMDFPVPLRDVWNVNTCPPSALPWLAWAFSVDEWDATWTVDQQRSYIRASVEVHRRKGTIGAVVEALNGLLLGLRVQEWFNQTPPGAPYTFNALLEVDQTGISQASMARVFAVIARTKNLRSHLTGVQVTVTSPDPLFVASAPVTGHNICLTNFV